jgi:predicted permease
VNWHDRLGRLIWPRRRHDDDDLEEEIGTHLAIEAKLRTEAGDTREDAELAARRDFGNVTLVKEVTRRFWGGILFENLTKDLQYALRMLRKSPLFTCAAVLALALGIGATTSIFSVIYAVFFDPYPYKNPDRIFFIDMIDRRGKSNGNGYYSLAEVTDLRKNCTAIEDLITHERKSLVLHSQIPLQVWAVIFSPNAFDFFGVPAELGRTFTEKDFPPNHPVDRVAVLSHLFWQRQFNGRTDVIGQVLRLNDEIYTVIGVVPPRFTWLEGDVYLPRQIDAAGQARFGTLQRRPEGISIERASAEIHAFNLRFAKSDPKYFPEGGFRTQLQSLNESIVGTFSKTLWILLAAVGCLLLIACGNVANLLLARGSTRQTEMAVRSSLGAGRGRIVRQLLTESLLLSLAGGTLGVIAAYKGVSAVAALLPNRSVPKEAVISVNLPVLVFSFGLCFLVALLFGLAPALQLSKPDVNEALKMTGKGSDTSARGGRLRNLLVVAQLALTAVLMTGSGLAIHGFLALTRAPLGYDPKNVLAAALPLPAEQYKTWAQRNAFLREFLDRARRIPGVQLAAINSTGMPPFGGWGSPVDISGQPSDANRRADINLVSADYLSALHIPLLRGRYLNESDIERHQSVAVIDEVMARRYWPAGSDPIGQRITLQELSKGYPELQSALGSSPSLLIVGIAGSVRNEGILKEPGPSVYIPYTLALWPNHEVFLRAAADVGRYENSLRQQVAAMDPNIPLTEATTLEDFLAMWAMSYPRFSTVMFSIFGCVGLLLAVTGIYSVIWYVVSRRTREFGLRMALGAGRTDIFRLVFGLVMRLTAIGVAIGLLGGMFLTRSFATQIRGMNANDPWAFLIVVCVLVGAALLASYMPAQKATHIQPMEALRHE